MIAKLYEMFRNAFAEKDINAVRSSAINKYLSESVDLIDLERRQRELMKKGWV